MTNRLTLLVAVTQSGVFALDDWGSSVAGSCMSLQCHMMRLYRYPITVTIAPVRRAYC